MRLSWILRGAGPALLALALAPPAHGAGGVLPVGAPLPVLSTSGDSSELIERIPIARKAGARDRVVMRLDPTTLDPIAAGDRLRASAEVQVSTTCVDPGKRCVGRSYDLNPKVSARIVLSPSPSAGSGFLPLSETRTVLCKQRRPNRNHHCTITIPNTETAITDLAALPCPPTACYVNLIVGAQHRKTKRGYVVVAGADQPDGTVEQDKGRLNLVQSHANVPAPTASASNALVTTELPLSIDDSSKRRAVYSVPIVAPRKGEVLAFDASFVSDLSEVHFNSFVNSRVLVATEPTATKSRGIAKNAIPLKGQATESNGFNCTLGISGYENPCTTYKAGAVSFTRDVVDKQTGEPATVYLNVLAGAKPLLAEKVDVADRVLLGATPGGLSVLRYSP